MSHKGNDRYLEELQEIEEDLKDAKEAYENAQKETRDAFEWEEKMRSNLQVEQERLAKLKNQL